MISDLNPQTTLVVFQMKEKKIITHTFFRFPSWLFILLFGVLIRGLFPSQLFAQQAPRQNGLKIVPVPYVNESGLSDKTLSSSGRTLAVGDTTTLPFWDDFSNLMTTPTGAPDYRPDTSRWTNTSQDVRINFTQAINPPTLGIATFDGTKASGVTHSNLPSAVGQADSLVSKPINLAAVPGSERGTVFFSFFWQLKGYGEFPDEEDSLILQFKDNTGAWQTQWSMVGGQDISNNFQQEIIAITDPSFYHGGFRFRFRNFSRLSGAFDEWHLDYIFLNKNRRAANTSYLDRAITSLPASVFGKYTAIPMKQFRVSPSKFIDTTSVQIYNLDVVLQPIRYSALIRNKFSEELIQMMDNNVVVDPLLQGQERRRIKATPINPALLNTTPDSLYLETEMYINSGDKRLIGAISGTDTTFIDKVNFRVNDTARATYVLHNYYAYDDGSAELGVGVNQSGGKIAYQFVVDAPDFLSDLDIYFPAYATQSNASITLFVWSSLDKQGQEIVFRRQGATIQNTGAIDRFGTYTLESPVQVKDTFYIGFQQQTDDFIAVGLDKNTDSGEKIFFNVNGSWERNQDVRGSLMMRPRFAGDPVTGVEEPEINEKETITLYPNPSKGRFYVKGSFQEISIMDILGKPTRFTAQQAGTNLIQIDMSTNQSGMYLITLTTPKGKETKRLVLVR